MDNLITISDFSNPFMVYAPTGSDEGTLLNEIITQYQKEILIQILGEIEYNDFDGDLTGIVPASAWWVDFLDGETYTHDSVSYVYPGIKPVLTKMMYYHWQVETSSNLGESGELKRNLINSVQVIPQHKMTRAFNLAIDDIYTDRTYGATVYNFMNHMQSDNDWFEDWDYTKFYKINTFNI